MEELEKMSITYFDNGTHLQFGVDAENLFSQLDPQKYNIDPQLQKLRETIKIETDCYKFIRKSDFSAIKEEVDTERDNATLGVRDTINMFIRHSNQEISGAAKSMKLTFDAFNRPTPIVDQAYDTETASIDGLLAEFRKKHSQHIEILGLTDWINELTRANNRFKELTDASNKEKAQKISLNMTNARKNVDIALKNIIKIIEGDMTRNSDINYDEFVSQWNSLVKHYNDIWAQHLGRLKAKKEKEKKEREEKELKEKEQNEQNDQIVQEDN